MPTTLFARPMLRALMPLCVTLTLNACASRTASGVIEPVVGADTFCRIAKPITWSAQDTDETIRGVKEHNAVFVRLCQGSAQ